MFLFYQVIKKSLPENESDKSRRLISARVSLFFSVLLVLMLELRTINVVFFYNLKIN